MSSAPEPTPSTVGVDDIVVPPVPAIPAGQSAIYNQLENERLKREALEQFIKGRGHWDTRIFVIMTCWLVSVVFCIAFQGFGWFRFHLSDAIIIAFITTTTVNVVGLGYIVAKFFFTPAP